MVSKRKRKKGKKPSMAMLIRRVVSDDYNEDQRFITITEFARAIFGRGYEYGDAVVKQWFEDKIRRSMQGAIKLCKENDEIFFPDRIPTQLNPEVKDRIYGWKIAAKGDERALLDEAKYKLKYTDAREGSLSSFLNSCVQEGLLSNDDKLKLEKGEENK